MNHSITAPIHEPLSRIAEMNARRRRFLKLGAAAGFGLLPLAETCLRTIDPQPASQLQIFGRHPRLPIYALLPNAVAHVDSGETSFIARTDQYGFRVSASRTNSTPHRDVLVIGGTNTFGFGVNFEDTYAGRMAQARPDLGIVNAAVPVYGPIQYRIVLEDYLSQCGRPRAIIVGFCPDTDFRHVLLDKDIVPIAGQLPSYASGFKQTLRDHSHLYRRLTNTYHHAATGADPATYHDSPDVYNAEAWANAPLPKALRIVEAEVRTIQEIADKARARLLFVITPSAETVSHTRANLSASNRSPAPSIPAQKIHAVLETLGIQCVDATLALARLPAGLTHHTFDRHLTARAHRIIFSQIVESGLMRELSPRSSAELGNHY